MHHLVDFKGFEGAEVELLRPFVLLIGRNGAGKTNVIEGVELLARLAHGTPLSEITDINTNAGQLQIRGGLTGCTSQGKTRFELGFSGSGLHYRVRIDVSGIARVEEESFSYDDPTTGKRRTFFEIVPDPKVEAGGAVRVKYDNFAQGGNKHRTCRADRSVLAQILAVIPTNARNLLARAFTSLVQDHLRAAFVFDPSARTMRGYARIGQASLLRDGSNLSSVLHGLSVGPPASQEVLARITQTLRRLPEEPIQQLEFITTEAHDVLLAVRMGADRRIDARLLSDGTLRALAILTALETAPEGSRVVVEEVDNGLHPSRVADLVRALIECGERRKLTVLCTTHNPALLDALTREQVESVVLCHRDPTTGAAALSRIVDLPRADELLLGGHLGDLVTRGIVERYVAPELPEQRKAAVQRWIDAHP